MTTNSGADPFSTYRPFTGGDHEERFAGLDKYQAIDEEWKSDPGEGFVEAYATSIVAARRQAYPGGTGIRQSEQGHEEVTSGPEPTKASAHRAPHTRGSGSVSRAELESDVRQRH